MSIDRYLRTLILVTLMPLLAVGVIASYYMAVNQRYAFQNSAQTAVRGLMSAVEASLRATITPLELLALAPELDSGRLDAFRVEAMRALKARSDDWANIVVSHPETGEILLDLLLAAGQTPPRAQEPSTVLETARGKKPVISNVVFGEFSKQPVFAVRVPVMRMGEVKYVLSAIVRVDSVDRLIPSQALPPHWAAAVFDGDYRFVARRPPAPAGREYASESLREALRHSSEGWQEGSLLDGSSIYRAVVRSSNYAWGASIAVPASQVNQAMYAIWLLVGGFALAAATGLWLAWRIASRISRPIAALVAATPSLAKGDETATLTVPKSISEVAELSSALTEAAASVRQREEAQRRAEQALRAADRAKDEFLAMLGHELRNPLAAVSNAAQLLRLRRDQPEVLDHAIDILVKQTAQMARLVDDLLEVGRVTGGKINLVKENINLALVLAELLATWKTSGRLAHHRIEADLKEVWVDADRTRIVQIVGNLLDNAIKYTEAGGSIKVTLMRRDEMAIIQVRDNGEGMPPELISRVFDLFVQGERSLARESSGLGIGLTMTKRLVELHSGTVRAQSDGAGKGSTFTIELPAVEPGQAKADVRANAGQQKRPQLSVLIVEDNADARSSLVLLLQTAGYEATAVDTGSAGITMAKKMLPDCVLIDIGLPDIDGYEVARRLRQDPLTAGLRLVALTGYGSTEDQANAKKAGFDAHATKPLDLENLEMLLC